VGHFGSCELGERWLATTFKEQRSYDGAGGDQVLARTEYAQFPADSLSPKVAAFQLFGDKVASARNAC
jgi:hypothetical protein